MDREHITEISKGLQTAFVNKNVASNLAYKPEFVSNNYEEGRKVLSTIESELLNCDGFAISVAFITMSGITPLLQTFKELEKHGTKGKILTTDYLTFSEPKALEKLEALNNIELKMYCTEDGGEGFHTKGYIFRDGCVYRIVVGSSNMTLSALTRNKEWNTKIVSTEQGEYADRVLSEFDDLWGSSNAKGYDEFIDDYRVRYEVIKKQKEITKQATVPSLEAYKLEPNMMQVGFIKNLRALVAAHDMSPEKDDPCRALLISATGTGKTYASAFALRDEDPKKALFIVHREQIAKQAIASYKKVFGDSHTMGLLSGTSKEYDSDFLFSTMQMMAKSETRSRFRRDKIDTIVIDEVHRAGAESYNRIMEYFEPKLWLGMTASPERPDGFDVFDLFDHNIAYEIRLQQALEEDLLCPFHYFGITDMTVDGELIDEHKDFAHLVSDDRVSHVIREAKYYGHSGDRVKGLIFCSRKDEGRELSRKFNERGYRTDFICGDDTQEKREECIERLTADGTGNELDYIFTIDIFNEGVDIPEINQVIMLRPTQSPIIFVQQLGRGLRKAEHKEYVVVLDFIGNYENNYMIPIALSGDRSYNKDNMRRYVAEGTRIIPGSSSVHFDEVARKQIYKSIDSAKTNTIKVIKDSYLNLKNKLGRIPDLEDFEKYDAIDPLKIFTKCGSYYNFLKTIKEKDYHIELTDAEIKILKFISCKFAVGKRVQELELLDIMLEHKDDLMSRLEKVLYKKYGMNLDEESKASIIRNMTNQFVEARYRKNFKECVFIKSSKEGEYEIASGFADVLNNRAFYSMVKEVTEFGIRRYEIGYSTRYKDTDFTLYQKYTYEDVCRILKWKENMNSLIIGGYYYNEENKTLPVFVNYDKADDAIAYEDRFVSPDELIALSKHPRTVDSPDADHIYKRTVNDQDNQIYLFVRKNKDDKEAQEFYFLGEVEAEGEPEPIKMTTKQGKKDNAFEIDYHLDVPLREDILEYIVGDNNEDDKSSGSDNKE